MSSMQIVLDSTTSRNSFQLTVGLGPSPSTFGITERAYNRDDSSPVGAGFFAHPASGDGTAGAEWPHVVFSLTTEDDTQTYTSSLTVDDIAIETYVVLSLPWTQGLATLFIGIQYSPDGEAATRLLRQRARRLRALSRAAGCDDKRQKRACTAAQCSYGPVGETMTMIARVAAVVAHNSRVGWDRMRLGHVKSGSVGPGASMPGSFMIRPSGSVPVTTPCTTSAIMFGAQLSVFCDPPPSSHSLQSTTESLTINVFHGSGTYTLVSSNDGEVGFFDDAKYEWGIAGGSIAGEPTGTRTVDSR